MGRAYINLYIGVENMKLWKELPMESKNKINDKLRMVMGIELNPLIP